MQYGKIQQAVANFEDERDHKSKNMSGFQKLENKTHCPHNLQKGAKHC